MKRLKITLPNEIAKIIANKPDKNRFIAQAIKEKIEREARKRIERLLIEGYHATDKEDEELDVDWEDTEVEGWK